MGFFNKLFGSHTDRELKKIYPLVDKIEALEPKMQALSDDELRAKTAEFQERYDGGEDLDSLLPEAFAAVREAAWRVLGMKPFRVQLIGGIVLHQGRIAEMKTGEGKTLVAVMPAYLTAITGDGVHIVTVNDYLARRDSEWMGKVHRFMGLSVGLIVHGLSNEERKQAYAADITYGTNNEMGFDYLRDNMVIYKDRIVQRGHEFAIVDEVDSILIDEARTPLIISGMGDESDELYKRTNDLVKRMTCFRIKEIDAKVGHDDIDADYIVDEKAKTAVLGKSGIKKAEQYFGIENLADGENMEYMHYLDNAIRAYGVMQRDVDYVVKDGQVLIVDSFTGRIMPGRRYSDGLHQAIEAKENVQIQKENRTIATITFQNYFRMYDKLSGMTGTALSEEDEFREIYNLDVVEVPTNKPMIRVDHHDVVYKSKAGKDRAIIEQIRTCHEKGQPVLVGTVSVEKSEELSAKLKACGIKHTVLNAKHHEREADIVAQAGKLSAVTISTNMAGRGTDILLGGNAEYLAKAEMRRMEYPEEIITVAAGSLQNIDEEALAAREVYRDLYKKYQDEIRPEAQKVCEAGGLFVIGTERHESRRIDNQLRGRSGRQGDPGESRFFLSLEDDLMRLFGSERIIGIVERLGLDDDTPIGEKLLSNSIENAQKHLEGENFNRRKNVLAYDDVMNQQRKIIYKQRSDVLEGESVKEKILAMMENTINDSVDSFLHSDDISMWDLEGLREKYRGLLTADGDFEDLHGGASESREAIREELLSRAHKVYEHKEKEVFGEATMREVEKAILLRNVDVKWMDHLEDMDNLMNSIGLQAYAQRNPINEYRIQGADLFDEMIAQIRDDTVRGILSVVPRESVTKRVEVARPVSAGFVGGPQKAAQPKTAPRGVVTKAQKVGRNDPCPCGSGKKYKKCCGSGIDDSADSEN